ncbi:helix-turn-helix transcriptional regulator [Streptomyces sp. NPDC049099]|uniref:helix-turn-helix domain-containing protein n=1 Tax=Streptomyces sp. NPDC049099 TaxID=3155768 RepID=UPI0034427771
MADDKKNPLGPIGEQVRSNVERLRGARGMTKKDLSDAVGVLGRPIPPLGVSRVEAGARRVDSDDLVALALALNVSPLALLLPPEWNDEPVHLAPNVSLRTRTAWLWGEGRSPANDWAAGIADVVVEDEAEVEAESRFFEQRESYQALTHPPERRRSAQHPANNAADSVSTMVARLVRAMGGEDKEAVQRQLRIVKNRLARLQNEIEQIELELEE